MKELIIQNHNLVSVPKECVVKVDDVESHILKLNQQKIVQELPDDKKITLLIRHTGHGGLTYLMYLISMVLGVNGREWKDIAFYTCISLETSSILEGAKLIIDTGSVEVLNVETYRVDKKIYRTFFWLALVLFYMPLLVIFGFVLIYAITISESTMWNIISSIIILIVVFFLAYNAYKLYRKTK